MKYFNGGGFFDYHKNGNHLSCRDWLFTIAIIVLPLAIMYALFFLATKK